MRAGVTVKSEHIVFTIASICHSLLLHRLHDCFNLSFASPFVIATCPHQSHSQRQVTTNTPLPNTPTEPATNLTTPSHISHALFHSTSHCVYHLLSDRSCSNFKFVIGQAAALLLLVVALYIKTFLYIII